jgi:hypothetical protein
VISSLSNRSQSDMLQAIGAGTPYPYSGAGRDRQGWEDGDQAAL